MKTFPSLLILLLLLLPACAQVASKSVEESARVEVLATMDRLSAATAPGGTGVDAYAAILANGFSRWTIGSKKLIHKQEWIDGMRGWYDDGWRVSDRKQQLAEIYLAGEMAFTRRVVEETYLGPNGDRSTSKAGLAETWVHSDAGWLLWRVNITVLQDENE
jgi:hypothetical protein